MSSDVNPPWVPESAGYHLVREVPVVIQGATLPVKRWRCCAVARSNMPR